jgi:hypothetical protein
MGFTGAFQFRDGALDPSNMRMKCPISELGATIKITNQIFKMNILSNGKSDSALQT